MYISFIFRSKIFDYQHFNNCHEAPNLSYTLASLIVDGTLTSIPSSSLVITI